MSELMESKRLSEERCAIANDMHKLAQVWKDENRSGTSEELEKFDRLDKEQTALAEKIETVRRQEKAIEILPTKHNQEIRSYRPVEVTPQDHDLALKAWALRASAKGNLVSKPMM